MRDSFLRGRGRGLVIVDDENAQKSDDFYGSDDMNMQQYEAMVFMSVLIGMFVCCFCSCLMKRLQRVFEASSEARAANEAHVDDRQSSRQSAVFRNSLATDGEEDWDCALCGFANRPRALNCNLCGTDHDSIVSNYTAVVKAAAQVMAGDDVSAYPLDARQLRASRRLQWRREVRPLPDSTSSSSPRSKKGRRGKRGGVGKGSRKRRLKPHGPQGGSLEIWRWRRNEPPPVPVPDDDEDNDDEDDGATSKTRTLGGWVKASFNVSGLPSSERKRRDAALVAAKLEADEDVMRGSSFNGSSSSGSGYLRLAGDSAGTPLPNATSSNGNIGAANTTPDRKARATSFNNPLLSLFGSTSPSSHPVVDPESSGNLQEPLLESSSSSSTNGEKDGEGTAAATGTATSASAVGAAVSAAATATSSFFFGARNGKSSSSPEDQTASSVTSDLAAYQQWAAVAVAVESDTICWEVVGSDSDEEDEDGKHSKKDSGHSSNAVGAGKEDNEKGDDDENDDDDKDQDDLPAKAHLELAAFSELKEGFATSELRLVGMAPFRDKHAWFDAQLRDRVQVPWAAGHLTLEIDRDDLLESSVEGLLRQVPPEDAKQSMRITFEGEQGVDVGGLEREWFVLAAEAAFAPEAGLFVLPLGSSGYRIDPCGGGYLGHPETGEACPSAEAGGSFWCLDEQLEHIEFVGRLLGKAVLERQSLPVALTTSLLKHLLGAPCTPADLTDLDPELAKHLIWLLSATAEEVDACCLEFTVTTTYTPPDDNDDENGDGGGGKHGKRGPMGRAFAVGEVVECRDGDEPWERGIVCGYAKDGSKVKPFVQRVDMDSAYVWDEVRKVLDDDDEEEEEVGDGGYDEDDLEANMSGVQGSSNGNTGRRNKARRGAADTSSEEEEGDSENEVVYEGTLIRADENARSESSPETEAADELGVLVALLESEGLASSHLDALLGHGITSVAQLASVLAEEGEEEGMRGDAEAEVGNEEDEEVEAGVREEEAEGEDGAGGEKAGEDPARPESEEAAEDQAQLLSEGSTSESVSEAIEPDTGPIDASELSRTRAILSSFKKAQLLKLRRAVHNFTASQASGNCGSSSGGNGGGGGISSAADANAAEASETVSTSAIASPLSSSLSASSAAAPANPYGKLTRLLFGNDPLGLTVLYEEGAGARPGNSRHNGRDAGSSGCCGRLCVTAVEPGRLAHAQGIEVGDWLVELNGEVLAESEADQTFLQNLSSLPKPVLLGFAKPSSTPLSLSSRSTSSKRHHHRASGGGGSRVSSSGSSGNGASGGSGKKRTVVVTHELKPGWQDVVVTVENRLEYCRCLTQWHLAKGIEAPLSRLLEGFYTVIPPDMIEVFDYAELEFLLCGTQDIDVNDWKRHTEYSGAFRRGGRGSNALSGKQHPVVAWFWSVVEDSLTPQERAKLFQFATGGGRVPAQGFKALQRNDGKYCAFMLEPLDPPLVQPANARGKLLQLPVSHTCFNRLDLPLYKSQKEMEEALKLVVSLDVTGFSMD